MDSDLSDLNAGLNRHQQFDIYRPQLDYLQFLELEVFIRFGARLEAGVEVKIRRGRLLRELLKQERLSPLSPEQHMAWLV